LARVLETSTAAEYAAIFNNLNNIIASLTDLRAVHGRAHGTVAELTHRLCDKLSPTFEVLEAKFLIIGSEFDDWAESAYGSFDISRTLYEVDEDGARCVWHDPSGTDPTNHPTPYRKGEEWQKFRAWVWSLPETQRSVEVGRSVDVIALDMLFSDPEGFGSEALSSVVSS
jgi:hypothetical protein